MNLLSRFARLSREEKTVFLKAASLLFAVRIGLKVLPYGSLRRLLFGRGAKPAKSRSRNYSIDQIVQAVRRASRFVPGATCLPQAIATQKLLGDSGHPSSITIGIAKEEGLDLEAHAWVICGEHVVIGGPDVSHYQPMLTWKAE